MQSRRQVAALSCHDVPFGLLTTPYGVTTIRRLGFPKDSLIGIQFLSRFRPGSRCWARGSAWQIKPSVPSGFCTV